MGILISSPAGNDLPFDSSQCEQGRNFTNKIWNAFRLVDSWEVKELAQPQSSIKAIEWFESRFNEALTEINDLFDRFKISEALMAIYKLVWDDFCSWYLEMIKPGYQHPIDSSTLEVTKSYFEKLLSIMHPFMPFITEELWHLINDRKEGEDIIIAQWPTVGTINKEVLNQFSKAAEVISGIRNVRKAKNIATKVKLEMMVKQNQKSDTSFESVVVKMGNLSSLEYVDAKVPNSNSFIVDSNEYFIPFGESIDIEAEKAKLTEELAYTKGFLMSVQKKLGNAKFVESAPEQVVGIEKKKEADALSKIAILEDKLSSLN
jgi:valyl-tRNA synthetase